MLVQGLARSNWVGGRPLLHVAPTYAFDARMAHFRSRAVAAAPLRPRELTMLAAGGIPSFTFTTLNWSSGVTLSSLLCFAGLALAAAAVVFFVLSWIGNIIDPLADFNQKATGRNNFALTTIYKPVTEEYVGAPCKIELMGKLEGKKLPEELQNCTIARVGPNSKFEPVDGYHMFDGDGMVYAVRIKNGEAAYTNRFINTVRLNTESEFGRALFIKVGSMATTRLIYHLFMMVFRDLYWRFLANPRRVGLRDTKNPEAPPGFAGTANTNLVYHGDKLLALVETDLPYSLKMRIDSAGRLNVTAEGTADFEGSLTMPFGAHPKIVRNEHGEDMMYGLTYDSSGGGTLIERQMDDKRKNTVTFHRIAGNGTYLSNFDVDLKQEGGQVMMHDFAATQKHAILVDFPVRFLGTGDILKSLWSPVDPALFDKTKGWRFGVFPLDATSNEQVRWIDIDGAPGATFHVLNAWEDESDGFVHIVLCVQRSFNMMKVGNDKDIGELPDMMHFTLDLATKAVVSQVNVSASYKPEKRTNTFWGVEFPKVSPLYVGRKIRYGYSIKFNLEGASRIIKIDLEKNTCGGENDSENWTVGDDCFSIGEPIFIPKRQGVDGGEPAEDDGFIATFTIPHDARATRSCMLIWDAKDMQQVAKIQLPARVPMALHGTYLTEEQLEKISEPEKFDLLAKEQKIASTVSLGLYGFPKMERPK